MMTLLTLGLALAAGPSAPVSWPVDAGTTAVLVEDHRVPVVELHLSFPAGTFSPWLRESHAGEAFEIQMYDPKGSLRAAADTLAARFTFEVGDYSSDMTVTCLKQDLPAVRALMVSVLTNKDFDPAELKRAEKGRKVAWEGSQKDFDFVLDQAGRRLLFAEGDPRRDKKEEPPELSMDTAALASARDTLVSLPGRVIGLAGDMNKAEAEAFAKDLLAAVGAAPANVAPVFQPVSTGRPADEVVKLPNLTQVYFALLREDVSWGDADYAASLITNHILGGHFYSRLYVTLRHEGGETYGARVTRDVGSKPGPLALTTFTRSENEATTEEKLRGVLKTLHGSGVTETELAEAKSALKGRQLGQSEAPGDLLGTWIWEHNRGLPEGFKKASVEKAAGLSLEEVNAFIQRFYDPSGFTMVKLVSE